MDDESSESGDFGEFGVPAYVIRKNRRQEIRIGLNEYKGTEYVDVRVFYRTDDGFRPSNRGVTLSTELYHELLRGVLELGALLGEIDQQTLADLESK